MNLPLRTPQAPIYLALAALAILVGCAPAHSAPGKLEIDGSLRSGNDVSAIASMGRFLLVAEDEGAIVQLLERHESGGRYTVLDRTIRLGDDDVEIDIEGLERDDDVVWVAGSHALVRRKLKPEKSRAKNFERLTKIKHDPERDWIFRFRIDIDSGKPTGPVDRLNLRSLLEADPVLAPFTRIPGKENGVNIEAIAVRGDELFLGFREPVLRAGFVPLMVLDFDNPTSYSLRYVNLDGAGIRGMTTVEGGFLLLAGGEIRFWDGRDRIPGSDAPDRPLPLVGRVDDSEAANAEGITLLEETSGHYEVIVVFDGPDNGLPTRLRLPKP